MKNIFYILNVLALFLAGCAGVEITKVTSNNPNARGIRYYQPWPYILVTADANNNLQTQLIYLPKMDEEYAVNIKSGVGASEVSLTLADGWRLTQYGGKADSKVPETIGALTGAVTALGAKGVKATPTGKKLGPGLYRCEFDANGLVKGLSQIPVY